MIHQTKSTKLIEYTKQLNVSIVTKCIEMHLHVLACSNPVIHKSMTFDGRFFGFVVSIDHSEVNTATRDSIVHMLPEYSGVFSSLRVDTLINS